MLHRGEPIPRVHLDAERHTPLPLSDDELAAVPDPVRDDEADADHLLREADDEPAVLGRRDFGLGRVLGSGPG